MATPLLATKLYTPAPRAQLVARPRLIAQLNAGLHLGHKLTLISAPAGFGKTTLASEWVATGERPTAWLSLDEADNDPTRFLTYFIAAVQSVAAEFGAEVLSGLQGPQPPPTETVLTALINESARLPAAIRLVLDDYHVLDAQPIDRALTFLLEHLPPPLHLVITTREDPDLPLARLRARGQLTELRAADLRFTPAEAAEFLNRVMGLNLAADDIAALETRTEGWIAGLQLAAVALQATLAQPENAGPAGFIQAFTGSHHFVLDYLLAEVLQRQPPAIQAFLLRTAILGRLCAPLCDAVLGNPAPTAQATLESLERANLFLVPLDHERRWYRYHHLFGDLLRQRRGRSAELHHDHLRASAWYEAAGDLAEAFQHASAAGDFERAARLAEAAWPDMERNFQTAAWLGWAKRLPPAVVSARPRLCVQLGWAYSDGGAPEASETYLQYAERALAGMTDLEAAHTLPGTIAVIRASNAQNQGDIAETVQYAELALQLIPEDDFFQRAQAAITLEFTHWATGDLEAALQAMHVWRDTMHRSGNQLFAVASAFVVADMHVTLGHLRAAEQALRQALETARALGAEAEAVTAHHHLGLALLAHERGDAPALTHHLHLAAELGQRTTLVDWLYRWSLAQARLEESRQAWEAALAWLDNARRVYVKNPVPLLQPVDAQAARVYLRQGRLDQAQAWVREQGLSTEAEARYLDEYALLTLARVRLAEGALAGVGALLDRLLALAETQKRTGSVIEILLTQALVQQAQRNRPRALAALEQALALAAPEGYLRLFVDEGQALHGLLLDFRATIETPGRPSVHPGLAYVSNLLAAFPSAPVAGPAAQTAHHAAALVEPLSARELEVLRHIARGLSNREISERLCVALSTVKGHNQRLFGKLQAQNRTEAVTRARELGLL